jgi:hypothetical protein
MSLFSINQHSVTKNHLEKPVHIKTVYWPSLCGSGSCVIETYSVFTLNGVKKCAVDSESVKHWLYR